MLGSRCGYERNIAKGDMDAYQSLAIYVFITLNLTFSYNILDCIQVKSKPVDFCYAIHPCILASLQGQGTIGLRQVGNYV